MLKNSLVFGIVGLTICPLVASIVAIVTGIVALSRISREPRRYGGRGMAIGGVVCGGLGFVVVPILLLMVSIMLPSLSRARELSKRLVCGANMKGISTTIDIYMDDHPGQGVPTFDILVAGGELAPNQLHCPSSGLGTTNYTMVQGAVGSGDHKAVMLYEPKSNHGDEGGNIVFSDGHVTFIRVPEYDELTEAIEP